MQTQTLERSVSQSASTLQPALPSSMAQALPMPRDAPVTMAT